MPITINAALAAPTRDMVKAEAAQRIEAILPDYKQRNALAFGMETMMAYGNDPADWPAPLQQVNAEMQAKWAEIKAIRVRSDEIEAMAPIPVDFREDRWWTVVGDLLHSFSADSPPSSASI